MAFMKLLSLVAEVSEPRTPAYCEPGAEWLERLAARIYPTVRGSRTSGVLALRACLLARKSSVRFLFLLCGSLFHQALGGFLLRIFLRVHCLAHSGLLGLEGTT